MEQKTVSSFKELIVWQKAYALTKEVYKITSDLPKSETFGLQGQMRRSAVSIPSNIAEGKNRRTTKDFLQFLRIAFGSTAELETQLLLAQDLYTLKITDAMILNEEVSKMLRAIIYKLSTKN